MSRVNDILDRLPLRPFSVLSGARHGGYVGCPEAAHERIGVVLEQRYHGRSGARSAAPRGVLAPALAQHGQPRLRAVALPGLLVLWRSLVRRRAKAPGFVLALAIAWPTLAAAELVFHRLGGGAFPAHELVVGAPFVTAAVAALALEHLRADRPRVGPWSIAVYSLALLYLALPRLLTLHPTHGAERQGNRERRRPRASRGGRRVRAPRGLARMDDGVDAATSGDRGGALVGVRARPESLLSGLGRASKCRVHLGNAAPATTAVLARAPVPAPTAPSVGNTSSKGRQAPQRNEHVLVACGM